MKLYFIAMTKACFSSPPTASKTDVRMGSIGVGYRF